MNSQNYRVILSIVSITIVATIVVQVYWNYFNYQTNKAELINQVRFTLDNAVDTYYADIARNHTITTVTASTDSLPPINGIRHFVEQVSGQELDTGKRYGALKLKTKLGSVGNVLDTVAWNSGTAISIKTIDGSNTSRHLDTSAINLFASKIFVSIRNDTLNFTELASLVRTDFDKKNWAIDFGLLFRDTGCDDALIPCDTLRTFGMTNAAGQLTVPSQSAFIPVGTELEIHFSNVSSILLQRSMIGMLLSLLLSVTVVGCLLYLFKTINQQKQLAEIKNDLISNITHEFKTPITTIGSALEGIENFSALDDPNKTKKYLGISNDQLTKLNLMVEKLLETASLDSDHLSLHIEEVNLKQLIEKLIEKYRLSNENKEFKFNAKLQDVNISVDRFHFENAVGNLIDNATKYGGNVIEVTIHQNDENSVRISVVDNGQGVPKDQRVKIFDKFYRVPTGNIHDVKGFGIGLYYAKNIVEKHGGKLELKQFPSTTSFEITLPYAN